MKKFPPFTGALLACCLLMPAMAGAHPSMTGNALAVFKTSDHPTPCPAGMHPINGCVLLTGKAATKSEWTNLNRIAIVDGPAANIPAGCVVAISTGTLSGEPGKLHFQASGYYCPKTDTAQYRYTFNAQEAERFGLPVHGTIRYVGSSNTETFTSSKQ